VDKQRSEVVALVRELLRVTAVLEVAQQFIHPT
jgi:hypothetical protein